MARKQTQERIGPGCYIKPEGRVWHVVWYDKHRTPSKRQYSLRTESKSRATEIVKEQLRRFELGIYTPWHSADRSTLLADALRDYAQDRSGHIRARSIQNIVYSVKQFGESLPAGFGHTPIESIQPSNVKAWVFRPRIALESRRTCWRNLKVFFSWALEKGHVDYNPVGAVQPPKAITRDPKYFTAEQVERLVTYIGEYASTNGFGTIHTVYLNPLWLRDAVLLINHTGLRRSEACRLTWGDVLWPENRTDGYGYIQVKSTSELRTKNDHTRLVTMIPPAEELLRRLYSETRLSDSPTEAVLKASNGGTAIYPAHLSKRFRDMRRKARVPDYKLHALRNSFAVELLMRGANLVQVKDELGHKTLETTLVYTNLVPQHRAKLTLALYEQPEERVLIADFRGILGSHE